MLPRSQRLSRDAFERVMQSGPPLRSPHFLFFHTFRVDGYAGGVSISKKLVKGAVRRHLLRRRVYAVLKDVFAKRARAFSVAVVLRQGADKLSFDEMKEEINTALAKES